MSAPRGAPCIIERMPACDPRGAERLPFVTNDA